MLLKSIRVYDADAQRQRENEALLKHINRLREDRPQMHLTGTQLLVLFGCVLIVAGIVAALILRHYQ